MSKIRLNIDGIEVTGYSGQTVLEIARENNIEIPTLCHDERVKAYGSCGLCVVEAVGMPKLMRSCATTASDNMIIKTNTKRTIEARQIALELLMSDHTGDCQGPCVLACPGNTDCQAYVGLIANGQFAEANKVIKDKLPLPASIGRVCPHPCETACRRGLVDEPIAIANLKYFAADHDHDLEEMYIPELKAKTGKKINIIGGGPGGVSAAYFLLLEGYDVTIYDQMPKLGGMLRYGIPQYRLPKSILQKEIDLIEKMGAKLVPDTKIGRDISFEHIKNSADATLVAIGAWSSTKLGCKGEEAQGVLGGIEFLENYVTNKPFDAGEKVAIVGGGNTAMDACRTSVRLGAKEVYNVYRRTKDQMPAEEIEIVEAEEEGVIFKELVNPIEIKKLENGQLEMTLQVMELGEPDASGRRSPIPKEGVTETLVVDCVISAIGQIVNPKGFEGIELTRRGTIAADEKTFVTNVDGVFAIGDATNKGADIAIAAIGDAKRAAGVIMSYLDGETVSYKKPFYSEIEGLTADDFEDREITYRPHRDHVDANVRNKNFEEVVTNYTDEEAIKEASRCLECGCMDVYECKLLKYANEYDISPSKFAGEMHKRKEDNSHPFIDRNADKCILCGLCVRTCDEVMGVNALGLVHRGFDTIVKPAMDMPLNETGCISCGQCISVCPTGALQERMQIKKTIPVVAEVTKTVCSNCSVGCNIKVNTKRDMILRVESDVTSKVDDGRLCAKGRFGYDIAQNYDRIKTPLLRRASELENATLESAVVEAAKKAQSLVALNGPQSLAILVSDKYTNEDIFAVKTLGQKLFAVENVYSMNSDKSAVAEILGTDASTASYEELLSTEVIVVAGSDIMANNTIVGIKIRQAVMDGAKLIVINDKETLLDEIATISVRTDSTDVLLQVEKAVAAKSKLKADEHKALLDSVQVSTQAQKIADMYADAKTAMIVYNQGELSYDGALSLVNTAVLAGHVNRPRTGIIQLKKNANSQGLIDLGICTDKEALCEQIANGTIKGIMSFGENFCDADLSKLEFVVVQDINMSDMAKIASIVLPGASFAESEGSYTNAERRIQKTRKALDNTTVVSNWKVAMDIARVLEPNFGFDNLAQIQEAIANENKAYKGLAKLESDMMWKYPVSEAKLAHAKSANLVDTVTNTSFERKTFKNFMIENKLI